MPHSPSQIKLARAGAMRADSSPGERHAWRILRNRRLFKLKFRRQHVLQGSIVDFYCPALRLVIELDGVHHGDPEQASYDAARTDWLEACGYRMRRVRNNEISRSRLEHLLREFLVESPLSRQGEGDRG